MPFVRSAIFALWRTRLSESAKTFVRTEYTEGRPKLGTLGTPTFKLACFMQLLSGILSMFSSFLRAHRVKPQKNFCSHRVLALLGTLGTLTFKLACLKCFHPFCVPSVRNFFVF